MSPGHPPRLSHSSYLFIWTLVKSFILWQAPSISQWQRCTAIVCFRADPLHSSHGQLWMRDCCFTWHFFLNIHCSGVLTEQRPKTCSNKKQVNSDAPAPSIPPPQSTPLHYYENTLQFTSVQDGIYTHRKAHTHSTPTLRSFPNVVFEMVPMFLWLTMALSHPFREDRLALPLFTSLSTLHYKRPSPVQPSPSPSVLPQRKHRLQWSLFPPGLHSTYSWPAAACFVHQNWGAWMLFATFSLSPISAWLASVSPAVVGLHLLAEWINEIMNE